MPPAKLSCKVTSISDSKTLVSGLVTRARLLWSGLVLIPVFIVGITQLTPAPGSSTEQASIPSTPAQAAAVDWGVLPPPNFEPLLSTLELVSEETLAEQLPIVQPWVDQVVTNGDNLSLIFKRAGFNDGDLHQILSQSGDKKALQRIYPGQIIAFQADASGGLAAVRVRKSPVETVIYSSGEAGFESVVETRDPEIRETWAIGEIESSLFKAGQDAGLSQTMIMDMATIFGGVIDFVKDPRKGDTLQLVYDELYLDEEKFEDGDIIAASFTNEGKTFNAFRYVDANGDVNYYNEEGISMRKAFLLAPVDFTRISSNFNLRRLHPIYKTTRPHRGTDYAASRGTPVYAAGDGRVSQTGYSRTSGNYVYIQHGDKYVTKYLHLHQRKVKTGQRVTQNEVIGTVGATGAATGPHLHYEFLVNGVHRDPRTIHKTLPKAHTLPDEEMGRFREAISRASMQLAALRSDNHLAMITPSNSIVATN